MADGRSMSFPGGLAYSGNAYAYAYAYSTNAYAYSAPGDNAGIGGFAGDPMLSAAVTATRDALLSEVPIEQPGKGDDRRAEVAFSGKIAGDNLPEPAFAPDIGSYGTQVRTALALFELSSSVAFSFNAGKQAELQGSCVDKGGSAQRAVLATMERPARAYFEGQLQWVDAWSSRRDVRAAEVVTQVAPPLAYFASLLNLQAGRHRRTLELVNVALQFTYAVVMQFKHALACPRPSDYSVGVQPMIEVPMHPALPAGHAAEAHVTAAILGALASAAEGKTTDIMLRRLAFRIAENRVIAGVHFPVDMVAGRLLGDALGSYVLARCGAAANWTGGTFALDSKAGDAQGRTDGFEATDVDPTHEAKWLRFHGAGCDRLGPRDGHKSDLLVEMWRAASAEWKRP